MADEAYDPKVEKMREEEERLRKQSKREEKERKAADKEKLEKDGQNSGYLKDLEWFLNRSQGFSSADIIWYEPMSQKYSRINKNVRRC